MDKKLLYESPTIDVITLQAEGVICVSGAIIVWGELGQAGQSLGLDDASNNYGSF